MDRNAKARVMHLARCLSRRTEKGRAYGVVTAKALAVLQTLLWSFHNARSGLCYPSYETIAEAAGCARSTVYEAISALEAAGLMSWVNRLKAGRGGGAPKSSRMTPPISPPASKTGASSPVPTSARTTQRGVSYRSLRRSRRAARAAGRQGRAHIAGGFMRRASAGPSVFGRLRTLMLSCPEMLCATPTSGPGWGRV